MVHLPFCWMRLSFCEEGIRPPASYFVYSTLAIKKAVQLNGWWLESWRLLMSSVQRHLQASKVCPQGHHCLIVASRSICSQGTRLSSTTLVLLVKDEENWGAIAEGKNIKAQAMFMAKFLQRFNITSRKLNGRTLYRQADILAKLRAHLPRST